MFKLDRFSEHSYFTIGKTKTSETGGVFVKTGNDYVAQNGDYLKKTSSSYLNLRTGVNSTLGNRFGDDYE